MASLPFNEPNVLPHTTNRARKLKSLWFSGLPIIKTLVENVADILERVDSGALGGGANLTAPPPIGTVTPNTGTFSVLQAGAPGGTYSLAVAASVTGHNEVDVETWSIANSTGNAVFNAVATGTLLVPTDGSLVVKNDSGTQIGSFDSAGTITWGDPTGTRIVVSRDALLGVDEEGYTLWAFETEGPSAGSFVFGRNGTTRTVITPALVSGQNIGGITTWFFDNEAGTLNGGGDWGGGLTWGNLAGQRFQVGKFGLLSGVTDADEVSWSLEPDTGAALFSALNVTGPGVSAFAGALQVTGALSAIGGFSSEGPAFFIGTVSFTNLITLDADVVGGGLLSLTSSGTHSLSGGLFVGGSSMVGSDLVVGGALAVAGQSNFSGPVACTNGFTSEIAASFMAGVTILGPLVVTGVANASNAAAGKVGEVISAAVTSTTSLTTNTAANTAGLSLTLTAGDWDVEANVNFTLTGATVSQKSAGLSTTSSTLPTDGTEVYNGSIQTAITGKDSITLPRKRINVSSTTTLYVVAKATIAAGTVVTFGSVSARRVR